MATKHTIRSIADIAGIITTTEQADAFTKDLKIFLGFLMIAKHLDPAMKMPEELIWLDDGKHDATINASFADADVTVNYSGETGEVSLSDIKAK